MFLPDFASLDRFYKDKLFHGCHPFLDEVRIR